MWNCECDFLLKCKLTLHLISKNKKVHWLWLDIIFYFIFYSLRGCIFSHSCAFAVVQLVMSSDKLASLNEPLVNVDLDLQDGAGDSQQVAIELDQEDLKKLLTSLESCSKVVQLLISECLKKKKKLFLLFIWRGWGEGHRNKRYQQKKLKQIFFFNKEAENDFVFFSCFCCCWFVCL